MNFKVGDKISKNLQLNIELFPYLGKKSILEQVVDVDVNGININKWHVKKAGVYSAVIPYDVITSARDNDITIKLMISNPLSPAELGLSVDRRTLGIALKSLVLME